MNDSNTFRKLFNIKFEEIVLKLDNYIKYKIQPEIILKRKEAYNNLNNCLKNVEFDKTEKIQDCKTRFDNDNILEIENIFLDLETNKNKLYNCINNKYGTDKMNELELNSCFEEFNNLNSELFIKYN